MNIYIGAYEQLIVKIARAHGGITIRNTEIQIVGCIQKIILTRVLVGKLDTGGKFDRANFFYLFTANC